MKTFGAILAIWLLCYVYARYYFDKLLHTAKPGESVLQKTMKIAILSFFKKIKVAPVIFQALIFIGAPVYAYKCIMSTLRPIIQKWRYQYFLHNHADYYFSQSMHKLSNTKPERIKKACKKMKKMKIIFKQHGYLGSDFYEFMLINIIYKEQHNKWPAFPEAISTWGAAQKTNENGLILICDYLPGIADTIIQMGLQSEKLELLAKIRNHEQIEAADEKKLDVVVESHPNEKGIVITYDENNDSQELEPEKIEPSNEKFFFDGQHTHYEQNEIEQSPADGKTVSEAVSDNPLSEKSLFPDEVKVVMSEGRASNKRLQLYEIMTQNQDIISKNLVTVKAVDTNSESQTFYVKMFDMIDPIKSTNNEERQMVYLILKTDTYRDCCQQIGHVPVETKYDRVFVSATAKDTGNRFDDILAFDDYDMTQFATNSDSVRFVDLHAADEDINQYLMCEPNIGRNVTSGTNDIYMTVFDRIRLKSGEEKVVQGFLPTVVYTRAFKLKGKLSKDTKYNYVLCVAKKENEFIVIEETEKA